MAKKIALILHGGCGTFNMDVDIERSNYEDRVDALGEIVRRGWSDLESGASALDVVESVVNALEEAPCFNAGIGGALDSDKRVGLDASIMRGDTRQAGAVGKLRNIPLAISVARKVMEQTEHVFLVDRGANEFARSLGFKELPDDAFLTEYQLYWWNKLTTSNPNSETTKTTSSDTSEPLKGTVGAVALDKNGLIVAGTSTGGLTRNRFGRVGDSPIVGAGTYADNRWGGFSATGYGEQILRSGLARFAIDCMRFQGLSADEAAHAAIREMAELPLGIGGVILVDAHGNTGFACNDANLPRAFMRSDMDAPVVQMEVTDS